jgi:hypothetical protein
MIKALSARDDYLISCQLSRCGSDNPSSPAARRPTDSNASHSTRDLLLIWRFDDWRAPSFYNEFRLHTFESCFPPMKVLWMLVARCFLPFFMCFLRTRRGESTEAHVSQHTSSSRETFFSSRLPRFGIESSLSATRSPQEKKKRRRMFNRAAHGWELEESSGARRRFMAFDKREFDYTQ